MKKLLKYIEQNWLKTRTVYCFDINISREIHNEDEDIIHVNNEKTFLELESKNISAYENWVRRLNYNSDMWCITSNG